tara:strand:+ start:137 stop:313 length:177 start_codon:yes stop_codon:yes gene_type:complete
MQVACSALRWAALAFSLRSQKAAWISVNIVKHGLQATEKIVIGEQFTLIDGVIHPTQH